METTPAIEAASNIASDPILTVIASAFGGAALTVLVTLLIFFLTGRREHRKWVNDLRFKTYVETLEIFEEFEKAVSESFRDESKRDRVIELGNEIKHAPLVLISSFEVTPHLRTVTLALDKLNASKPSESNAAHNEYLESMAVLITAMKRELGMAQKKQKTRIAVSAEYLK